MFFITKNVCLGVHQVIKFNKFKRRIGVPLLVLLLSTSTPSLDKNRMRSRCEKKRGGARRPMASENKPTWDVSGGRVGPLGICAPSLPGCRTASPLLPPTTANLLRNAGHLQRPVGHEAHRGSSSKCQSTCGYEGENTCGPPAEHVDVPSPAPTHARTPSCAHPGPQADGQEDLQAQD